MEVSGVYRFYQNGELIGEAKNSMTKIGRILAIKTIMGAIPNFATSLGVGVSSTPNTTADSNGLISDMSLGLRVATCPVIGSNVDTEPSYDVIIFKGRLSDPLSYRIHEVGLFSDPLLSGGSGYKQELIMGFEFTDNLAYNNQYLTDEDYSSSTIKFIRRSELVSPQDFRIGNRALYLAASGEVYTENGFVGLDKYDPTDRLTLGFYASTSLNVVVKFYTDSATKTYTFASGGSGYKVVSLDLSAGVDGGTGTFDWDNITKVSVSRSTGTAIIDGLKIENISEIDTNRGLVSRAVLPENTPIVKLANIPVDIEYSLRIGFNG